MTRSYFLLSLVIVFCTGCNYYNSGQKEEIIAKAGDKVLLRHDLRQVLSSGMLKPDSIQQANNFIQRWIKQELMLSMAEKNLTSEEKDFHRELEEYRSSLIIHRYQQQLLSQKLDTVLTENDIRQFYDKHPEQFVLDQNLVKAVSIEIPRALAKPAQIKKLMLASDDKSRTELEVYSFQYATKFDYFNNQWIDFNRITSMLPVDLNNKEQFLKRNKFIEANDRDKYYFVSIKGFCLAGDKAPFDYVKGSIENLILNNRKMEFIQELEKNIYIKGQEENLFKLTDR